MAGNIPRKPRKEPTPAKKKAALKQRFTEFDTSDITTAHAWSHFIVEREARGCEEETIKGYKRFYKKLCLMMLSEENGASTIPEMPVSMLASDAFREAFILSLNKPKPVSPQTVNYYLRSYRAFGNFCEEQGYIEVFKCPIKEVDPPLKDVYTKSELERLLKEPSLEDFVAYRNYSIIVLILTTGARSNTILNIQIKDVDLENGYINFNKTKSHKTVPEGLDPKCIYVLRKYIDRWRSFSDTKDTDYLFCASTTEGKLARNSLCQSIAKYNNDRGVEKTSLHLFRHTFAKMWIQDGGDIITLARVLTHSELEMVKRYSNLYGTDVKKAVETHSAIAQLKPAKKQSLKTRSKELSKDSHL